MQKIESYAIAGVLLIAILAALWAQKPLAFYEPKGYVEKANRLIAAGKVKFDPATGRIEARGMDKDEQDWYINSYLGKDVEAFNTLCAGAQATHPNRLPAPCEPFADRFLLDGATLIRVNGASHVAALPGTPLSPWKGELRYYPRGGGGTLQGERQTVSLMPLVREVTAPEYSTVPIGGPERWFHARVASFRFVDSRHRDNGAEVWSIGSTAVLKDRQASGQATGILIRGNELLPGRIVKLHSGDWIHFQDLRNPQRAPGSTYLFSDRDLASMISWIADRNNRTERVTRRTRLGFADEFVSAMNGLYREVGAPTERPGANLSVDLTVQSDLQDSLSGVLRSFMEAHFGPKMTSRLGDPSRPHRAGAAILDLFSGDVLALPTYPAETDLDRFVGLSPLQRKRLLGNQNLPLHHVGSAAKGFWTAAIVNRYPFMAGFTLPAHAPQDYETAAGRKLTSGYEDHNHGDMNVESFLEVSCNKFVVDLATVGLALKRSSEGLRQIGRLEDALSFGTAALDKPDRFGICGQTATQVPDLSAHLGDSGLEKLDQNPIFTEMEGIHNIETYAYRDPKARPRRAASGNSGITTAYRSDRFVYSVWGDLANKFPARSDEDELAVRLRLGVLSPERVNFGVNRLSDLRTDWVSLLLGGSTGLWNNVQLAEALSRLVSGKAVEARFTHAIDGQREARQTGRIPGYSEIARRLVLAGLNKAVAGASGTATKNLKDLRQALQARYRPMGYDVLFFGKTGTPTVDVFAPSRTGAIARELYQRRGIAFDQQRVSLTPSGFQILSARGMLPIFAGIVDDMNQNLGEFTLGPTHKRRGAVFAIDNGVLQLNQLSGAIQHSIPTKGAVFILAVVLAPSDRTRLSADVPACISPAVAADVRAVPPMQELNSEKSVGIAVAAYVEDTDKVAGEVAVRLVNDMRASLETALDERLAAKSR